MRSAGLLSVLMFGILAACAGAPPLIGGPFPGDPANMSYELDGTKVELKAGTHEQRTGEGVDDFIATDLTGSRADADFDGDGSTDAAVVLTRDEGTLKVHYLAVLRNVSSIEPLTVRLGKNILVERVSLHPKGGVVVELLGHGEGSPEEEPPSVALKKRFEIKNGRLEASR